MKTHVLSLSLLMMSTTIPSHAFAQASPEIVGIELGQAGIARYTMLANSAGNTLSFEVPEAHSDDVLASLIVLDPAGGVIDLQTNTPGSVDSALADSPFVNGIPRTTQGLLAALIGEEVAVTTTRGTFEGRVLSTGVAEILEGESLVQRAIAMLLTDKGVSEVVLTPGARVSFTAESAARLAEAVDASQVRDDTRVFDLTLEADSPREIGLSYVTEAAAWKNSWRLILDEGRLQGWATLENVSGADWDDVTLTLTTGEPVAYRRALLDPLFIARDNYHSEAYEAAFVAPVPIAMEAAPNVGLLTTTGFSNGNALRVAPPPPSTTARAGEALMSSGILRYLLPEPVDLENGRTANLMYLDMAIEPEIRGLYQPTKTPGSVLLAAAIETDQPLASGLVSVQDGDGFVGDAVFEGMLAGQKRLLPFAAASGATVLNDTRYAEDITGLLFKDRVLSLNITTARTTEYTAELPEQAGLFTVDHPMGYGRIESTNGTVEVIEGANRITVPVAEGAATVRLVEHRIESRQISLGSNDLAALLLRIENGQVKAAPAVADALQAGFVVAQRLDEIMAEYRDMENRQKVLVAEQARLRENLEAVQQDALRNRYFTALDETETEIGAIFDAFKSLEAETVRLEAEFAALFTEL